MPSLPISTILTEASHNPNWLSRKATKSTSELYSQDVESMSDDDIDQIIEDQRTHRERMKNAEALGAKAPRIARAAKVDAPDLPKNLPITELEI